MNSVDLIALQLADNLMNLSDDFRRDSKSQTNIMLENEEGDLTTLKLTPPSFAVQKADASHFFVGVSSLKELIIAYDAAYDSTYFERDFGHMMSHVDQYATRYLEVIFNQSKLYLNDEEAMLIAKFVSDLDVYSAVKAVESFVHDRVSLALLKLVHQIPHWHLHLDHFAIRSGSEVTNDALEVANMLISHHGYQFVEDESEQMYHFSDGWSAYVLYKLLENGQILRVFVDQSDSGFEKQIIQYWNQVYGYTAHHMALRVTTTQSGTHEAIPLRILMQQLTKKGFMMMTPTGSYTQGLLEQVFTAPEIDSRIPSDLMEHIKQNDSVLESSIKNGKLLELVSRKEMPMQRAKAWYTLMGLVYKAGDRHFSMPMFNYFLPAQAAHVIKSSL